MTHPDWERIERRTVETGGVMATTDPVVLATVLGSCVAVCLFDPQRGAGGMNHFLLPGGETDRGRLTRFGAYAMEVLINEVMRIGGERHRLLAKVFGGGRVLPGITTQDIGGQNATFALAFLNRESIPVVSQLLQLPQPLEVRFFPQTGRALVRRLAMQGTQAVAARESSYQRMLKTKLKTDSGGDVTLF
jgi:chemotaxis receptor (MCP) glutamine deamidase CheD